MERNEGLATSLLLLAARLVVLARLVVFSYPRRGGWVEGGGDEVWKGIVVVANRTDFSSLGINRVVLLGYCPRVSCTLLFGGDSAGDCLTTITTEPIELSSKGGKQTEHTGTYNAVNI